MSLDFNNFLRATSLTVASCLAFGVCASLPANASAPTSSTTYSAGTTSGEEDHILSSLTSDKNLGDALQNASDAELQELSRTLSAAIAQIPESALQSEESWQEWRKNTLAGGSDIPINSIGWMDAAKCAGGIAAAAATAVTGLAMAKKLITVAKNVSRVYRVLKNARNNYVAYMKIRGAKKSVAAKTAIYDAFKADGGKELADIAIQLIFGVSGTTIGACIAAVQH